MSTRDAAQPSPMPGARDRTASETRSGASAPDDWWRTGVVYQVYPRSFADSNGDGMGDLGGVLSRVSHFRWLGVGAVWLSPFYPSGGVDNGYDVSDYRAVDPAHGSIEDFDSLVDELHRHDIRVIVDQVYNHSSDEHPWFEASRSSTDDPHRDWYIWRPPRAGHEPGAPGAEPNDWRSFFGGPAWTLDAATGEYYLHLFHAKQPDLNWASGELRAAVYDTMRWWLDRGVDGLRLDVVNFIAKPGGLPDAGSHRNLLAMLSSNPRLHEHLGEMRRALARGRRRAPTLIGEMPGATAEVAARATDSRRGELDMVISFDHVELDYRESKWDRVPVDGGRLGAAVAEWQVGVGSSGWNALYFSSHDQPRAVSRFGDDRHHRARSAKTLATVLHLHRGTPFVYQGEEVAMANYPFTSLDQVRDVESTNFAADGSNRGATDREVLQAIRAVGRDNARTPMQWDGSEHGGFTTASPWIDLNPDHDAWNVAAQRDDPTSVLDHYRWLIALRREEPTVAHGSFEGLVTDHPHVYAFARELDGRRLVVVANLSGTGAQAPHLDVGSDDLIHVDPGAASRTSPFDVLEPWESRISLTRAASGR